MLNPSFSLFTLTVFYIVVLLILSFSIYFKKKIPQPKNPALFLFFFSLLLRFLPAYFLPFAVGYDVSSFILVGEQVTQGQDIYSSLEFRHQLAALPAYPLIVSSLINLSQASGFPLLILIKIFPIFCDALIPLLIFRLTKSIKLALVYAISPLGIIVSALMGQFESIPLFFTLLALYCSQTNKKYLGGFSLGYAAIFKPWPLIFLPLIVLCHKNFIIKLKLLAVTLLPIIFVTLLYQRIIPGANIINIFTGIGLYTSGVGWWGASLITRPLYVLTNSALAFSLPMKISQIIVIALIILMARYSKKTAYFTQAKYVVLIIYCFSFGLSVHYLLWIFPLALITRDTFLKKYLLYCTAFLIFFAVFGGLNFNFLPPAIPLAFYPILAFLFWLFFVTWLIKEVRTVLRNYLLRGIKI